MNSAMSAPVIIRHLQSARLWIDQSLSKYQQGNEKAGYWDLSLAEAELKRARQIELDSVREPAEDTPPGNVVSITLAQGWRTAMKVSTAAAACFVFGFLALHWSDYSLKLLTPREALLDTPITEHYAQAKPVQRIYISMPTLKSTAAPRQSAPAPAPDRAKPAPAPEPRPESRSRYVQPQTRTTAGPVKPQAKSAPVSPKTTPVTPPRTPPRLAPQPTPAPAPTPPAEVMPAPEAPPVIKPAPAPTPAPGKSKPKVDYLDLLREAEKQLR